MVIAFPNQKDNLSIWDRFVDKEGKTTLNKKEYKEFRLAEGVKAAARKKQANAAKGKKGKM